MRRHHIDMDPATACASLRQGRTVLRARIAGLRAEPDAGSAQGFAGLVASVEAGVRHEDALLALPGAHLHHLRHPF